MNKNREQAKIYLLFIDLISIVLSYFLAAWIRHGFRLIEWFENDYGFLFALLVLGYICVFDLSNTYLGFFKRGFFDEFISTFRMNLILLLMIIGITFLYQGDFFYSRTFIICFFFYNIVISYIIRQYLKIMLLSFYKKSDASNKVMVITVYSQVEEILQRIQSERTWEFQISSIAIFDKDMVGESIMGIPVKANIENIFEVTTREVVDEVFISIPYEKDGNLDEIILQFENIGIVVNLSVTAFDLNIREKTVADFGGYHVLTFSTRVFDISSLILKRLIDIVGATVGLLITIVLSIIIIPLIFIESPGSIFFSQVRVGRNGRRFKIYKFRSMYRDAEGRKKELMEQNEMDGFMFKISNDPRITKIGRVLRKTSLDELPQFYNIIKGDMSLVGTRPPTEDEFLQYEGNHKRRLSLRPGLTGLWQTSGRSDVAKFEDVVKLDLDYIDNWSLLLDIKLLIKTVVVVVFRIGAK